ncbi:MAG TPA: hypothetical protein VFX28_01480, partial [Methylomirabilota bacterium]|nr:hypothetical protein [Methylomirabilota bacterium]
MRSAALCLVALAGRAAAQRPAATELGVAAVATFARGDLAAGGVTFGHRPGQARVALLLAGGGLDGSAAVRAEATAQFLVNPGARAGVTAYGAAGVAYVGARGTRGMSYLTMFLGIEQGAARSWGWYGEAGLGGGLRIAVGVRWRR